MISTILDVIELIRVGKKVEQHNHSLLSFSMTSRTSNDYLSCWIELVTPLTLVLVTSVSESCILMQ